MARAQFDPRFEEPDEAPRTLDEDDAKDKRIIKLMSMLTDRIREELVGTESSESDEESDEESEEDEDEESEEEEQAEEPNMGQSGGYGTMLNPKFAGF